MQAEEQTKTEEPLVTLEIRKIELEVLHHQFVYEYMYFNQINAMGRKPERSRRNEAQELVQRLKQDQPAFQCGIRN
jgi:hypothetical protein